MARWRRQPDRPPPSRRDPRVRGVVAAAPGEPRAGGATRSGAGPARAAAGAARVQRPSALPRLRRWPSSPAPARGGRPVAEPELVFLTDGGQPADAVLSRLIGFLDAARTTLDLAVYDAHLESDAGDRLVHALDAAEARGVRVRAVYNDAHRRPVPVPPPPEGPSLLARLAAAVPSTAIPGIPDLMHHKYIVRDGEVVWTGSTNWTDDAWTHMENV
ncbi:MAG: hypothetical protein E6G17_08715, partial [Actinobacteria bacterium]